MASIAVATGVLGMSACGGTSEETTLSAHRASAGSEAENAVAVYDLADTPELVVGSGAGIVLDRVVGALFLGSGIAIADQSGNEILLVDSLGGRTGSIGGEGQGPGEFAGLAGIARRGTELVAWDQTLLRLSVFDSTGDYASSVRVRPPVWHRATLLGATENAALFRFWETGFRGPRPAGPVEVHRDDTYSLISLDDGGVLRIDTVPGDEVLAMREGEGGLHGGMPVHFGASSSGTVAGGRAYVGAGGDPELRVFTEARDYGTVAIDHVSVPVLDSWTQWAADTIRAHIDAVEPGLASTNDGRNFMMAGAAFRRVLLDALPARSVLPVFSQLLGGADGRLWVRKYPTPTSGEVHWLALNDASQPEQLLRLPLAIDVLDLDDGRALVLERGPFGEALVAVYRFRPRERGSFPPELREGR